MNEKINKYNLMFDKGVKAFDEDRFDDAKFIFKKLKGEYPDNSDVDDYLKKISYFIDIVDLAPQVVNPTPKAEAPRGFRNRDTRPSPPKCPGCGSTSIATQKKGYSLAGGLVGAVLVGPIGLLGGALKANNINNVCQNCGHTWKI